MPQKVLIVDDTKPLHGLLRARLVDEPIELHSAYNGTEGLAKACELLPDVILLDVDMPEVDGFEVCRRLKADPKTAGIPVIFLTGAAGTAQKILGLELGAVDYVTKPFDPAELKARLRTSLRTKYLMDLLAHKAQVDGLTGLWNRAYFDQRLGQEASLARRSGRPLSCVLVDVDHFKSINDRFGHPFGDDVLRALGALLVNGCRNEDVVCRYGGETFAVLIPNTDLPAALVLARRMRQATLTCPPAHKGKPAPITCSFGAATYEGHEREMVIAAEAALKRAKESGRDRIEPALPGAVAVTAVASD